MAVELVIIGSEMLLGETLDTNTQAIARALREEGFTLQRVTTVSDDRDQIAGEIRSAAARADAVITTGGLGPTVDDPTRAAAAQAAGVELVFDARLWEGIQNRFARQKRIATENNRVQACLPAGAEVLLNPYGTAPGFAVAVGNSLVCSMPGVPAEMAPMLRERVIPLLRARLGPQHVIRTRTLHVAGLTESQIDDRVGDFEKMENPVVGLAAHPGRTDVRITARGREEVGALEIISRAETDMRARLEGYIFGADQETLAGAALRCLGSGTLVSAEWGTGGALAAALGIETVGGFRIGMVLPAAEVSPVLLMETLKVMRAEHGATHALGACLAAAADGFQAEFLLLAGDYLHREQRLFLVPAQAARQWTAAIALTLLWKNACECTAQR